MSLGPPEYSQKGEGRDDTMASLLSSLLFVGRIGQALTLEQRVAGLGAEASAADCPPPDDGPPGQHAPPDARPSGAPQVDRNQVLLDAALSFRWQRSLLLRTAALRLSHEMSH